MFPKQNLLPQESGIFHKKAKKSAFFSIFFLIYCIKISICYEGEVHPGASFYADFFPTLYFHSFLGHGLYDAACSAGFFLYVQSKNTCLRIALSLAGFIFLSGQWVLLDSKILTLFGGNYAVVYYLSHLAFYLLMVPFLLTESHDVDQKLQQFQELFQTQCCDLLPTSVSYGWAEKASVWTAILLLTI